MENVLVAVFDSDVRAHEAAHALESMFDAGVIRLTASAIVTKSPGGAITVTQAYQPSPQNTLGASAVGILIGMLAGTIGLAIGFATGLIVGSTTDMFYLKLGRDFLADVERALEPGKAALVAQIYEEQTGPVDERMAALGGVVLRRTLRDLADDEYQKIVAAAARRLTRA